MSMKSFFNVNILFIQINIITYDGKYNTSATEAVITIY